MILIRIFRAAALVCTLVAVGTIPLVAQGRPAAPEELYQQALTRERSAGDLQGAIQLYRQVAASSDRVLAARALVRLGEAYEKLGARDAQAAYERILREFSDQVEPVSIARGRLQALRAGAAPAGASPATALSILLPDLPALRVRDNAQFDFSPNGDQIVFRHARPDADSLAGAALEIASSAGAVIRTLLPAEREMGRAMPRWSPDGRHIAFLQRSFIGADTSFTAVMVVPAEGGAPRILSTSVVQVTPAQGGMLWTPDSRGITLWTPRALVTLDLNGAVTRELPLPRRHLAQLTGYSPDGRFVAFHRVNEGSEQDNEVDIWIVSADGGAPFQLTDSPGYDGWATWAPDGRSIYFVSDRGGSSNVWRQEVDARSGRPQGAPTQVTSYTDATILYPRVIDGGRRLAFALVRPMSAIHVASTTAPSTSRTVARGDQPQLSPDGRTLYYLGQGAGQPGIFTVAVAGGTPRRLTATAPGGAFAQTFALSRDGSAIAYFSRVGVQNVLFTVPAAGGPPVEIARFDSREHLVPAWSPDGRRLAYVHGDGLYVIPSTGGTPTRVAQLHGWDGWSVRWSPDGEHIAAFGWPEAATATQQNAVYVVPAAGGEPRRLTTAEEGGYKEGLEWHPDGRRLTYMYYGRDGRGDETRVAYLDGRPTSRLLDQPYPLWDYVGLWHPAGHDFYLISASRGVWGLYAHAEGTGATRKIWLDPDVNPGAGLPSFSADGGTMAWPVTRTVRQVWSMELGR